MLQEIKPYPLQPKQKEFSVNNHKYRLFGGAKGGGKSYAMRAEAVRQCLSAPKVRGLAIRRTLPEIRENMIIKLLEELPDSIYRYNESKNLLTFHNRSTLRFSYCKNEKDVLQFQGIEYDFICIEELTHWREKEFKTLMQSLRSTKPYIMPNAFFSTNPGGIGHSWVKRIFINRKFGSNEDPNEYSFIPAKVWDNQILVKSQPDYINNLLAMPEVMRKQFLEGDWDVFEGQYFSEFNRELHTTKPQYPDGPQIVRRIVSCDYGYDKPACVLWMTQDNQDNIIVYRELYITGLTREQLFIRVKALTKSDEKIDAYYGDPSFVNSKSEDSGITGQDIIRQATDIVVIPAKNDRVDGWQVVRKFLQPLKNLDFNTVYSRLKISESCPNLIRTLPEMVFDSSNVEDLNSKLEDHAVDALRYGLVHLNISDVAVERVAELNKIFDKKNYIQQSKMLYDEDEDEQESDEDFFIQDNFLAKEF